MAVGCSNVQTRSQATRACTAGHVTHNGLPAKAATKVQVGDRITCLTASALRILEVQALLDKRGPASVAQTLYEDHTPPEPPKEEPAVFRDRGSGRPSKREQSSPPTSWAWALKLVNPFGVVSLMHG